MDKKQQIKEAALQLLVEKGIHAAPMSAIATAAKTGMGTIYNHFENKEALINAIYVDIKQQEAMILETLFHDEPVKTQFDLYYRKAIDFFVQNPLYFQFMEQLQASPMITEETRSIGYQAIEPVIRLLKQGQAEGIIKGIAVNELLQFLGGTILSHLRWQFNQQASTSVNAIDNQLRLTWDAIKA
ncbi:MAG: TetR/AcrR family transcriptional regulator [Saprospiraceae bacterium]|nr:TetR/AcrR family transcriptional regulator [Saprospiraceae bacterium]